MGGHAQQRGESLPLGPSLDMVALDAAAEGAGCPLGRLGPSAVNGAVAIGSVSAKIKVVAVAGAAQRQFKIIAVAPYVIGGAAMYGLARSARQRDIAFARP